MTIYFITGNSGKYNEMKTFVQNLEQMEMDLPEIQEIDAQKVIEAKIIEAKKNIKQGTQIIIEDTSLYVDEMNGLPGPLIKWFIDSLGVDGVWNLVKHLPSLKASAKTIIGYLDAESNIHFFEGSIDGEIVKPRGVGFGWNPLFQVQGTEKNFTEMIFEEKKKYSMRARAAEKFNLFLNT